MSQGFEIIEFNCPFCGKKLKFEIKNSNFKSKVIDCDCNATLITLNFNNQELKRKPFTNIPNVLALHPDGVTLTQVLLYASNEAPNMLVYPIQEIENIEIRLKILEKFLIIALRVEQRAY